MRGMNERVRQLGGELKVSSNDEGMSVRTIIPTAAQAVPSLEPDLDSESVLDYRRKRPNLP
jgi:signal transduction histidine kinase